MGTHEKEYGLGNEGEDEFARGNRLIIGRGRGRGVVDEGSGKEREKGGGIEERRKQERKKVRE